MNNKEWAIKRFVAWLDAAAHAPASSAHNSFYAVALGRAAGTPDHVIEIRIESSAGTFRLPAKGMETPDV